VDDGGDAAGDGVFDELDEWRVSAAGELLQQVPPVTLVFDLYGMVRVGDPFVGECLGERGSGFAGRCRA